MTQYFLVKGNESNLVVVVDDDTLLAAKTKADRKVFFKETKEETEDYIRTVVDMDWKSWDTMPDTEFHDMIEAMDPNHAEVLVRYKVYSDEEVPSQWGSEDGHMVLEPIAVFPRKLKSLRKELNMSMKSLSDKLDIPYRTWQDWEAGRSTPVEWSKKLLLEKLGRMVSEMKNNMFTADEIYSLLAEEAMRTGKTGDETVEIRVLKYQFNKDLDYRPSLFWEDDGDYVIVLDVADQKIYTANRETGTFIEEVNSIEEGLKLIERYEEEDKKDDIYESNFYDVVDEQHNSLIL